MVLQMTDIAKQTWSNKINTSSKLSTYKDFKALLNPEKYLQVIINTYFICRQLTRFRISDHQLLIEEDRHRGIDPIDRKCKFCDMNCVENEFIFYWCIHCTLVFTNHIPILSKLYHLKMKK